MNTFKLFISDNAKLSTQMAKINKINEFKCPSTLFSLPGNMVGNLPVTILLGFSFKVKSKQTNKPNMCYLMCRILQISKYQSQGHNNNNIILKISLAMAQHLEHQVMYFRKTLVALRIKRKSLTEWHTCSIINSLNLLHRPKWMVAARSYCICADGVRGHVKLYEKTVCFHASCSR